MRLEIVTAERVIYSEDVSVLVAPGADGELGILPRHAPLLTTLVPGEIRVTKGGEETYMVVSGGFLEVIGNRVTILADTAEQADEIDIERAEAALNRAQERAESAVSDMDLESVRSPPCGAPPPGWASPAVVAVVRDLSAQVSGTRPSRCLHALQVEGHRLERQNRVDVADDDPPRNVRRDRRVVEDSLDPVLHHLVYDGLGLRRRHRDHSYRNVQVDDGVGQILHGAHFQVARQAADLIIVAVEGCHYRESPPERIRCS